MLTREKEQLADSVKFLENEIRNADNTLLEKEKDLNAIKTEKEREVCSACLRVIQIWLIICTCNNDSYQDHCYDHLDQYDYQYHHHHFQLLSSSSL